VIYVGQGIDLGYRIDLIVQGTVIVEIKCVASINPVHQAQHYSPTFAGADENQAG
jgi:GxxExxY protein